MAQSALNALKLMYQQEKGSKLKKIESQVESTIGNENPFFIRLDGCGFSKFLKGVLKPFDSRITDAMVRTTGDLVTKFNCTTGYTSSDEISLIFSAANTPSNNEQSLVEKSRNLITEKIHPYNGRMQKLASITAGFASARFNYHLNHPQDQWVDMSESVQNKMKEGIAYFDSRVVPCPSTSFIMETIYWRSNFDAFRNAISQISLANFPSKALHGVSVIQQIENLEKDKGIDVFGYHPRYLFGTWIKKKKYIVEAVDRKTGENCFANRTKICCGSFNWADYDAPDREDFLMAKYWDDACNLPPLDQHSSQRLLERNDGYPLSLKNGN